MVDVNENKQDDNRKLAIIRKLFLPIVIGNCINREKIHEYYNSVIYQYSENLEKLQDCDIVIEIVKGLYLMDFNKQYVKSGIMPFILALHRLDDTRKAWCKDFANTYIANEYKEKFNSILNTLVDDSTKGYSIFMSIIIDSEVYEKAMNILNELINEPHMLMIFNHVFNIIRGVVIGIDIEDIVAEFNSFDKSYKVVAKEYIDEYITDVYKGILHEKLCFGEHK